jgi:hypothetical protein
MCGTTRTMNKTAVKDTKIKFYQAMAVPVHTHGSEIWITIEILEAKTENCRN